MKCFNIVLLILKRIVLIAMTAVMLMFTTSCEKEPQYHDTTYVWGINNWDPTVFGPRIAASADSTEVRYVYLLNDGQTMEGASTLAVLKMINMMIDMTSLENRDKIRGAGTLNDVGMKRDVAQSIQDSVALAQMGFKFGKVLYGNPH